MHHLWCITSVALRATSVKSSVGIITHQSHISQVSANAYVRTYSLPSLLERLVTLKSGLCFWFRAPFQRTKSRDPCDNNHKLIFSTKILSFSASLFNTRGCMKTTIISLLIAGGFMFSLLSLISLEVVFQLFSDYL